jgi:hypothetical protein
MGTKGVSGLEVHHGTVHHLARVCRGGSHVLLGQTECGAALPGLVLHRDGIGFHLVLIVRNPHGYDGFSTSALLPLYRWAFRAIFTPYPLTFALAAAAFEIAIGLLLLGKGQYVKMGLFAGSLFLLAITPLGIETLPNVLLALGLGYLATRAFPMSFWGLVRAKLDLRPRCAGE